MPAEFDIIAKYFTRPSRTALLGVGDDCALIRVPANQTLAVSTDTLAAGTHFFADVDPRKLGHKALAVNLSDLAAMGATPRYATLALTLSGIDESWIAAFADGFFALAEAHDCELIGGDTTRGPLSMTITVMGTLPDGIALRRDAACVGDDIWVSGDLGAAALALMHLRAEISLPMDTAARVRERLEIPQPRVQLGVALRALAHASIDLSDGLLADLGHICARSGCRAMLDWSALPMHSALTELPPSIQQQCVLAGGDDYELCFTAPTENRAAIESLATTAALMLTRIGTVVATDAANLQSRVSVSDQLGNPVVLRSPGFEHFPMH